MIASTFLYAPYYCEENIWQLCGEDYFQTQSWVLFISNFNHAFAIWNQKLSAPSEALIWDYHVVLLHCDHQKNWKIFDFDTRANFGCPADFYVERSFPKDIPDPLTPSFLVQESTYFRSHFRSNRAHMRDEKGDYLKKPPNWNPISLDSNLNQYLAMDSKNEYILSLDQVRSKNWSKLMEECHR